MSEEIDSQIELITIRSYLANRLNEARGNLMRLHIEAARNSENIYKSTKLIQKYYKFMHRIEVITELLEEFE